MPPETANLKAIIVYVSKEDHRRLKKEAEREGRSLSNFCNKILHDWIAK